VARVRVRGIETALSFPLPHERSQWSPIVCHRRRPFRFARPTRVNRRPYSVRPMPMRAWRIHEYGEPSAVLQLDEVDVPEPEPGELRVRVQAIPLNLNDLERITGGNMMVRPELPYSPGMEVMGVVDACGAGAERWADQRVVAMPKQAHGGFAEYAICPAVSTFEMPEAIPLPGAAALYFPFHLAWLGLIDRAALQGGESVLIHAAAGGSGSAAVQLAVHTGARVFATAGTDEKVQLCRDLGADVAINYNDADFAEVVLKETGNRGVDVVFDNVGEAVMEKSLACTAYNGRYLMMGFASNKLVADEPLIVPRRLALGNLKLCGVLLAYAEPDMAEMVKTAMGWNFASGALGESIMREIVELVLAEHVKPLVGQVVSFEELPVAVEALARRATTGRTVALLEPS
jgi:NADPH2:quinone reductase